ncbi:glycoside hydrolase family 43 protein [Sphingomonas panni]
MRGSTAAGMALATLALLAGGSSSAQVWRADQGDGTYRNPLLFADYPDPDIIRVASDYYFVTTTFANAPGLTLLHSKDLVNWQIFSHVVPRLDDRAEYRLAEGKDAYRRGLFAASLRFHGGMFYVVVTPVGQNTRIYRARDPRGPWLMNELDREAFDAGLFIEGDGTGYIATSIGSDGTIRLLKLDPAFRRVVDDRKVHYIAGAEGSKIVRRSGYYYLFNAIPRRLGLTVSRARSLYGPWETRPQIDDRSGGHQGALVDTADGRWVGFVMLDAGAIGRTTNLSPIFWQDDWPVWGTPNAPNRVPARAPKPIAGFPFAEPATSDDFSARQLGGQWQWNHNPDDGRWSLRERPGFLRLRPTRAEGLWSARNTLTQKAQGPRSRAEVKLDIGHVASGDRCGFGTFGQYSATLAVTRDASGRPSLSMDVIESTDKGPSIDRRITAIPFAGRTLWIGLDLDFTTDRGRLSYSGDGVQWQAAGGDFPLAFAWRTGTFQGQQMALSCYNPAPGKGYLDVDSFRLRALPDSISGTK